MYRRILDYFVGASAASTEEAVQAKKEGDDTRTENEIAKLTAKIEQLEKELKVRTAERDILKEKLGSAEKELLKLTEVPASSTISTGVGESNVTTCDKLSQQNDDSTLQKENEDLRSALSKSDELLKDKTELCANQERQNLALTSQVVSLKEVVAITKDLLNIRNMEVEHLHSDMESMESKINAERSRHNDLLQKMDEAANINAKLKSEYQTQLKIFQDLKEKYEQKVNILTAQNDELKKEVQLAKNAFPVQKPATPSKELPKQGNDNQESEDHVHPVAGGEKQVQKCCGNSDGQEGKDRISNA